MRMIGTVKLSGTEYILAINNLKSTSYYYLYSKYHEEDRMNILLGNACRFPIRELSSYKNGNVFSTDYMIGCIVRKNIGGDMSYMGDYYDLLEIIQVMQNSTAYTFKSSEIEKDETYFSEDHANYVRDFKARDESIILEYKKVAGFFFSYNYKNNSIEINLNSSLGYSFPPSRELKNQVTPLKENEVGSSIFYSNVKSIDYDAIINNMGDTSWYFEKLEDGSIKYNKEYLSVKSINAFEDLVITPLVQEIKKAREEGTLPVIIGLDTETDGLDVYNIPTELQSKVVAIPLAFKDNCALLIYTGMEYFNNIPMSYVKSRLEPFLVKDILNDNEITIKTRNGDFSFKRSEVFVTGHNIMFDAKAFRVHSIDAYFDADTMQMSFTLDPFLTKRKNSLKHITHKLLNCATPELTDVLGKGNEDKFKYINDERVALLYGGADADFSRLVFKELRKIFKECEPFHGKDLLKTEIEQDILLMNVLSKADFDGIRIDREVFVAKGQEVLRNMEIITEFAHKYVGRVIAVNEHQYQYELLKSQGLEHTLAQVPDLSNAPPYEFKFSGKSLTNTLFTILKYPILTWTEPSKAKRDAGEADDFKPKPAVNKVAMKRLMEQKHSEPVNILKSDILGCDGKVLIEADVFNSYKYPVAYLVSLIGPRKKEYDSYFKSFVEDSYGNMLCKSSKFSSIDTRRIANPTQTIKGSLKQYMLPYDDSYAMCDWDMSQVELRIMASLAGDLDAINRMKDPEADSHTETAAVLHDKESYLVSAKERKAAKGIGFGYPYGLMRPSMCEQIFGDKSDYHLAETQKIIESFEKAKHQIVKFLNGVRDNTLKEVDIPNSLREYLELEKGIPVGVVRNIMGFYKLFQLDDMTEQKASRIRRQSGNFPIQSFAAELFRIILVRLYKEFWRLGWIQKDWIRWHIVIHDELLLSFNREHIHPIHLSKVLHQACTLNIDGHTNYYIGVNIGDTWGDCKDDARELPVYLVDRLIKRWDSGEFEGEVVLDPQTYMDKIRAEYISERIHEELVKIDSSISSTNINCQKIQDNFTNYTVKKYVYECYKPLWNLDKNEDAFDASLASWALDFYIVRDKTDTSPEEIQFTLSNGHAMILTKGMLDTTVEIIQPKFNEKEEYNEMDWELDGSYSTYTIQVEDLDEKDFNDDFDINKGNTFESIRKTKDIELTNITLIGNKGKIRVTRKQEITKIESLVVTNNLKSDEGIQLYYSSPVISYNGSFISKDNLHILDNLLNK